MYSLIVFLPLLGAIIAGFFGRFIGVRATEVITSGLLIVCAILSWIAFSQIALDHETVKYTLLPWVQSGSLQADWAIRVDTLTVVMLCVVTTVSSVVHVYSIGYMAHDPYPIRFFSYLSFFTFAMLMLVTSDNLLQLFFGWEGVGLASYLLIGFWYEKDSANAAAIKAFVVNRVGDFGFALGIFATYHIFGSIEFDTIFASAPDQVGKTFEFLGMNLDILTVIALLLFMGAMGKSAQFLLHTWLPDAMEGPTPVSALIHAATMVTAGVFLVARMSPVFELAPNAMWFVALIGATTCFFAATIGLVQNDIKRVIAYSTCSQLGYMFAALGVGAFGIAVFHLTTHAFFKALLFLGSGSVIHGMGGEQDMRKMGGLFPHMKITWALMLIGTLALTGFPVITAGYYSKDAIIEATYSAGTGIGLYAFILTDISAALTAFYAWRVMFMTFHGRSRVSKDVLHHVHESPNVMVIPCYVLAVGALGAGYVLAPYFTGAEHAAFWGQAIAITRESELLEVMHHLPFWIVISPSLFMALGFFVAFYFYILSPETPKRLAERNWPVYQFLLNKWYFDEIYHFIFVRGAFGLGKLLWKQGDGRLIDGLGPDGISARVLDVTRGAVRLQTGYLYHYAFAMLIGIAALVTWLMYAGA
ncbi:NADH-quinone oxidoreductase subunit L [Rhodoligotrophos appendicifer]|uniref:NADH-quinone oxidoreductase subunit L n=1 Tax=Rhodoligotrophos appendicifer TaxID=987056 RepID=UPI0011863B71|nr:NADH-quinone oxidoreductase subunit L [Rhodoligotrophos appendicifer]